MADQFSLELQRQFGENMVARVGYVGTFGKDLFQTLDGNPRQPEQHCTRVDPTRRCHPAARQRGRSWYHSLQTGLEKRFSGGLSAGVHYTWSQVPRYRVRDLQSVDAAKWPWRRTPSTSAADKGRSSYDRPHRLTGNFVWELPWMRDQQGVARQDPRRLAGRSFFTFQSGAPFTVLNGSDPTGALAGIDGAGRQRHQAEPEHEPGPVEDDDPGDHRGRRREPLQPSLRRGRNSAAVRCAERVGNVGRNTLRADGIGNVDFSLTKNTRFLNGHNMQFRVEMFNATNTRNFGIPRRARERRPTS